MRRWIAAVLICLCLVCPVQAICADEVLSHNQSVLSQWVNWRPAAWDDGKELQELAEYLEGQASSRAEIPLLVHDWLCENIYYDYASLAQDTYSTLTASDVLRERRGVCEGIANLAQSLLLETGIPCIKVWGIAISESSSWEISEIDPERVNHTWNEFYMDGQWHTLDCAMDTGNRYENGQYVHAQWKSTYFDPEEAELAKTHKRLYRGNNLPEDIPSSWAVPLITQVAEVVPLHLLSNYHAPITQADFCSLYGLMGNRDNLLTRGEAAVLATKAAGLTPCTDYPFCDLSVCSAEVQGAVGALWQCGAVLGVGNNQYAPETYINRQEAIAIWTRLKD